MLTALSFILVFGLIVFVHELGHFLTARLNDVKIHEFSIGMGPVVLKKQGPETLYALRLLPIGGYVRMEGEDETSEDPRSFTNKKPIQRFFVLVAGATMNFVLALVLLIIIMVGMGAPSNIIGGIIPDHPAYEAGLQENDKIIEINGVKVSSWENVIDQINASNGNIMNIVVERDGELAVFSVNPISSSDGSYKIGIQTKVTMQVNRAIPMAWSQFKAFFTDIFKFFVQLGSRDVQGELMGPVGLVSVIGQASRQGIWNLLFLAAYISVNLGIVNLLPFPALDGGRIVFIIIEMIMGKPISREKEGMVHFVGIVLLMTLMVFLVYNDIQRL